MDYGRRITDRELKALENRIIKKYNIAFKKVKKKAEEYLTKFEAKDAEMSKKVKTGEIKKSEYIQWREETMLNDDEYNDFINDITDDIVETDKEAVALIGVAALALYVFNRNYAHFEVCSKTRYNLPFKRIKDQNEAKKRVRRPSVDVTKDKKWVKNKVNACVYKSMKQGKSIPEIAKDLQKVTGMDSRAAIRTARTTVTRIENSARVDSYLDAIDLGIKLKHKWLATLDERTRSSHRKVDGEIVEVGSRFSNGLRYPGDETGAPEEIYNCRCGLVSVIEGKEYKDDRWSRLPQGMTYEEWVDAKPVYKRRKPKKKKEI